MNVNIVFFINKIQSLFISLIKSTQKVQNKIRYKVEVNGYKRNSPECGV